MSTFVKSFPAGGEELYVFDDAAWVGTLSSYGQAPTYFRGGSLAGAQVQQIAMPGRRGAAQIVLGILMIVFFPIVAGIVAAPLGAVASLSELGPQWVQILVGAVVTVAAVGGFVWLEVRVWKAPTVHLLHVYGPQINVQMRSSYKDQIDAPVQELRRILAPVPVAA